MKDQLQMLQLDQLAEQTAQSTFAQTDPVAKRAVAIFNEAVAQNPDVQKAKAQTETDRKALLAKIDSVRHAQGLDNTWDWDFTASRFVKTGGAAPAAQTTAPVPQQKTEPVTTPPGPAVPEAKKK
jgi:hypothetical protein